MNISLTFAYLTLPYNFSHFSFNLTLPWLLAEAVTGGVLRKKLFLKISQNSQENICAGVFFDKVAAP